VPTEQNIAHAAEQIERNLASMSRGVSVDPTELCKIYGQIKGPLGVLLPVVKLIPVYGSAVAQGLQLLMGIADKLCPTD
jgi:hypothetical protein